MPTASGGGDGAAGCKRREGRRQDLGEEALRGVGEAERSVGNGDGREMIENDIE